MVRLFSLLFLLFYTLNLTAQDDYYAPTADDSAYRKLRARLSIPPYGLNKVKSLIKNIKSHNSEYADGSIDALPEIQFKSLTLREKFTYVMIHPEISAQNCAIFLPLPEEQKKIFGHLISWTDETDWSDRQLDFMRENRDSVITIIQESVRRSGHMGVNYKDALETINGWEIIPFLVKYYTSNPHDKDALTLLLLLMKQGEYKDFIQSKSYEKLYGSDYNYENFIKYNQANENLIIKRALGYYEEKKK